MFWLGIGLLVVAFLVIVIDLIQSKATVVNMKSMDLERLKASTLGVEEVPTEKKEEPTTGFQRFWTVYVIPGGGLLVGIAGLIVAIVYQK